MNQYVYTVQVSRLGMLKDPTAHERNIAGQHLTYMGDLFDDGVAIFGGAVGVRDSRHKGVVIYQAEDDDAAKAVLHNDPAVKSRIMRGRWFPFRLSLWNGAATKLEGQQHYCYLIQAVRPEMLSEGPNGFEQKTMSAHYLFLKDKVERAVFCLAGPTLITDYSNFGLGVLRAKSEDEAWDVSKGDPAVINRVMRLDVLPFGILRVQDGYQQAQV
jgi:uncharacterized protein YciI